MHFRLVGVVLGAVLLASGCAAATPASVSPSPAVSSTVASAPLASLAVGQCTSAVDASSVQTLSVVDCTSEHFWEVSAVLPVDGDDYPGEIALRQRAATDCPTAFEQYVGVASNRSMFRMSFITANQSHWSDPANHKLACLVGTAAGGLTSSLKDTHLSFPLIGQCISKETSGTFSSEIVDCSKPHAYEAFAVTKFTGSAAPTDAQQSKLYRTFCVPAFKKFVGVSVGKSKYELLAFMVPPKQWKTLLDHRVVCTAGSPTAQITGSLKGVKK